MKKNIKFIIAIVGITIAIFGSFEIKAKQIISKRNVICSPGDGACEVTSSGSTIYGHYDQ